MARGRHCEAADRWDWLERVTNALSALTAVVNLIAVICGLGPL